MINVIAGLGFIILGALVGHHAGMYLPLGLIGLAITFIDGVHGTWQTIAMWLMRTILFVMFLVAIVIQKMTDEKRHTTPKREIMADGISALVAIIALSMLFFQAVTPWWVSVVVLLVLSGALAIYLGRHWVRVNRENKPAATVVVPTPAP